MGIDPDLDPIIAELRGQISAQDAKLAEQQQRHQQELAQLTQQLQSALDIALRTALTPVLERLSKLETAVVAPPAPAPTPTTPAAPKAIWDVLKRTQLSIPSELRVPPGTQDIYIPVTADHTDRESFYAYVSGFTNVNTGGINVGNSATQRTLFTQWENVLYRWSPGDDPTHYVHVRISNQYAAGKEFLVNIRVKGLGDSQKGRGVKIIFDPAATIPPLKAQFHRPLRRLDLSKASRRNLFHPSKVAWSPSGFDKDGRPIWRSQVAHGRTQDGNQETGLYADETIKGADKPISYDAAEDALRLHTRAFEDAERLEWENRLFRHQAAMINGQTMDEVCGTEGVWRMVAKIPIRKYSWPAFWLVGRSANSKRGSWAMWPPEIDILEKFNYAWGAADTPFTTTFAQHYGKAGSNNRVGAFGNEIEVDQWSGVKRPLDEEYHSWACAITHHADPRKSEVTFFFDDVEVGCHVLHARHEDMKTKVEFYPMANVAVKANTSYSPARYNTDDGRNRTGDMLVYDIGYYPSGFTMPSVA